MCMDEAKASANELGFLSLGYARKKLVWKYIATAMISKDLYIDEKGSTVSF